jgi:hypothetical protein
MSQAKTQKAKLPVPAAPAEPPIVHTTAQIGPFAAMVRNAIEQIAALARGPYEAFIMLMTISGLIELHYAANPWPTVSLVVFGVTASLVARVVQKRWP